MKSVSLKLVLGFFMFRYITRIIAIHYYPMPLIQVFTYPYPYLAGIYAFILTYVLLVNPMKKIERAMRQFKSGQFDVRINIKSKDELGTIAGAFNELADRIEVMIHSERRLRANIGHEIKTPLARVMLHLTNVADHVDVENSLKMIEQEVLELSAISEKLLKLAQIERGEFKPVFEKFDLNQLIQDSVKKMQIIANRQNCRILTEPCQPILVNSERGLLDTALVNIIENALRYSFAKSNIQVLINQPDNFKTVEILVRDQGPGVPEADLHRIFQPFERTDESRNRNAGGTGLGLAICSTIVEHLGGKITARNLTPGFEVCISLPATADQL